eukprot:361808-Chlamydomonas_euryale.AAC.19
MDGAGWLRACCRRTYRGDDAVGLALPEGDLALQTKTAVAQDMSECVRFATWARVRRKARPAKWEP